MGCEGAVSSLQGGTKAARTGDRRRAAIGIALALLCAALPLRAEDEPLELRSVERLRVDDAFPDPSGEAAAEIFLRAETEVGEPVEHLRPVDVALEQDGEAVDPEDVQLSRFRDSGHRLAVVLLIDTSRTMKGEPFERAIAAAASFVAGLHADDRVAVVAFSEGARLIAPFEAERDATHEAIAGLKVDDSSLSTLLFDGIHLALERLREAPELPRRRIAVVFSDGKDSGSAHDLDQLVELARGDDERPNLPVFSIGYARFGGDGLETLRRLADETGAESFHATSSLHLDAFFEEIHRQILDSYVVRFPAAMDGERHEIRVTVEQQSQARSLRYPERAAGSGPGAWIAVLGLAIMLGGGAAAWRQRSGGGVTLQFVGGARSGESVRIGRGVRLGAVSDNDVVIDSPPVSRYHARIAVRDGRVEIEDLGSRNGTFVNGTAIQRAALSAGDRIQVGDVELELRQ